MIVVDANLLVYAVDRDSERHKAARSWWERTLSEDEPVGVAWVVALAFLRITTRPGLLRRQLRPEAALAYIDEWVRQPCVAWVAPGPEHWRIFRNLLAATGTSGNLTSDAHLAAVALEHGGVIHSLDADFGRFPGVRFVDPLR